MSLTCAVSQNHRPESSEAKSSKAPSKKVQGLQQMGISNKRRNSEEVPGRSPSVADLPYRVWTCIFSLSAQDQTSAMVMSRPCWYFEHGTGRKSLMDMNLGELATHIKLAEKRDSEISSSNDN